MPLQGTPGFAASGGSSSNADNAVQRPHMERFADNWFFAALIRFS